MHLPQFPLHGRRGIALESFDISQFCHTGRLLPYRLCRLELSAEFCRGGHGPPASLRSIFGYYFVSPAMIKFENSIERNMLIQAAHRGCAAGVLVRQGANAQIYGDIPENSIVSAAKPWEFFGKCFFSRLYQKRIWQFLSAFGFIGTIAARRTVNTR